MTPGETVAQGAQVLADHGEVVLARDQRTFLLRQPDPTGRIRGIRDAGVLGFQDRVGDVRALVRVADDEVHTGLDQELDVARGDRGVRAPLGVPEHHLADLRVRERLEDGLHAGHLAPHVESAAVGVAHREVAPTARVTLRGAPAFHRLVERGLVEILVRPGDRGEDDVGHIRDRTHRLIDERLVGVGALPVLRERTAPGRAGGPYGAGLIRRFVVPTATRGCHEGKREKDPDDLDAFHAPPSFDVAARR